MKKPKCNLPAREGYDLIRLGDVLTRMRCPQRVPQGKKYLRMDGKYRLAEKAIFSIYSAKDGAVRQYPPFFHQYLDRTCIILQDRPYLFDAAFGAVVTPDVPCFSINTDVVNSHYLLMQLYKDYVRNQHTDMEQLTDMEKSRQLLDTWIYVPHSNSDMSIYEQHQIFIKHRDDEIRRIVMATGARMGDGDGLSPSTPVHNGKYQIIEDLDNGGFGKIYHAIAKGRGAKKDVALKELFVREYCRRKDFSEMVTVSPANQRDYERQKSKFADEYNILRQVRERTMYVPELMSDIFAENNTMYYAMQYIDNGTLWHHCYTEKDIDVQDKLRIVCQAGIALHHAHDLDYLHLDVTPVNIMVDSNGKGILIDFGNSKHYSVQENKFTSVGNAAHTKRFAPPELMQQVVGQYYMEMDVYSLAMTLFAVLMGMVPEDRMVVGNGYARYIKEELAKQGIDDNIQSAIVKATQYEVNDRYPTVRDFLLDLLPAIDDEGLCKEIRELQRVTGFNIDRHKVNLAEGDTADYTPLSE